MKLSTAAWLVAVAGCVPLRAGFLPMVHLDQRAVRIFDAYIEKFEREVVQPYAESGRLWMDAGGCCMKNVAFAGGRPVVQGRMNEDIEGGSIHHFSGSMHLNGATIADMSSVMRNYDAYPVNFRPDVSKAAAVQLEDSSQWDDHFQSRLTLIEMTVFMDVAFDSTYDTHYKYFGEGRWFSKSASTDIRELKEAKHPDKGTFPAGDDHGFLWRTSTYWFVRESSGGIDMQVDSISLGRTNVPGFAWFGTKRSHDAVEKMLHDARTAIEKLHGRKSG